MGIYVSYVEPCHGNPRQLTAEENFGCLVPRKTSVARYRGTLGENFHHEKMAATAKFSKKNFFCFFFVFFVLIHYGIDVYTLLSC